MSGRHIAHETLGHGRPVKQGSDRAFGVVFAVVFAMVGLFPLLGAAGPRWWALAVGLGFLAVALARPALLAPLNRLWLRFGLLLHRIVSPLVMGMLFFLVVTPTGLLMRLCGNDPMRRRRDPAAASYWLPREPGPAPESMKHQF